MRQTYYSFIISVVTLLFLFATDYFGQNERPNLLIEGALSLPTGNYGTLIGNNASITRRSGFDFGNDVGLAKSGVAVNFEIVSPISKIKGLGWIFSGKLIVNPSETSEIQNHFQSSLKGSPRDTVSLNFQFGDWIHIPFMTGFSYGIKIFDDVSAYLSMQGGIDISKQPSRKISSVNVITGRTATIEDTKFEAAISYGFSVGIDFEFMNKYNLGLQYLNLGNPGYTGKRTLDPNFFPGIFDLTTNILNDKRPVNMLLLSIGYRIDI